MKKLLLLTTAGFALSFQLFSQTMTVFQNDGKRIRYNVSDVAKIVFEEEKPFDVTNLLSAEYVPDIEFRDWIDINIGDGSGYLSLEDAKKYNGSIKITGNRELYSIQGIEYFPALTELEIEDCPIGDFNIGSLKDLESLKLRYARVSNLDLTGLTKLTKAVLSSNQLETLQLGGNTSLVHLYCDANYLTSLDASGCSSLETLICSVNEGLSTLKIPESPLVSFSAHTTSISHIDLSEVVGTLDLVNVNNTNISHLDLTGAKKLTWLECSECPLEEAPILAGCNKLETIRMERISNEIGNMDFTECSNLNQVRLDYSKVGTSIDFTQCKKLYELSLQGCGLQNIDLTGLINLGYVNVCDNNFRRLDISKSDGMWQFWALRNAISGAEIKVWKDFDIADPEKSYFYIDSTVTLVYEFSH
ncbi:MAG: hypothetical protein K2G23_02100 [Muribaculaceae bacterium]|nr:hypothetical protein [Muribaculaceae bacterium]